MRRMLAYLGALFPATTLTTLSDAAVNHDVYENDLPQSRHGEDDEGDQDGNAAGADGDAANPMQSNGPVGNAGSSDAAAVSAGDENSVTREINGLLNELDRINEMAGFDLPMPGMVYGAPADSNGMYAPAGTTVQTVAGGSQMSSTTEPDAGLETDPAQGEGGAEPDSGLSDEASGAENPNSEPAIDDNSSMLVMLAGSATGADGATTDGDINLEIVDYGSFTVAYGVASFSATADWDGSGEPPADALTYFDVYGADMVFVYHLDNEYTSQSDGGLQYTDSSTIYVVAIDFEDDHPLANEFDAGDDNGFEPEVDPGLVLAGYGPVDGYFDHPLLGGLAFNDFSLVHSAANGDVAINDSGADLIFSSTSLDGSEDALILAGDVNTIEDIASTSDLITQTSYGELSVSVSAYGPDTYASIDGEMLGIEDGFSGVTGLAIGIA